MAKAREPKKKVAYRKRNQNRFSMVLIIIVVILLTVTVAIRCAEMSQRLDVLEAREERQIYLKKHLPELADKGQINLFFTCIYCGQLALMHLDRADCRDAFERLKKTSKAWRLSRKQKSMPKVTHHVWAQMAEISLGLVCRVRNALRIGL